MPHLFSPCLLNAYHGPGRQQLQTKQAHKQKMSLPSESFVTCRTQIANQQKEVERAEEKGYRVREGRAECWEGFQGR